MLVFSIFFDQDNVFQWASVAAIIAGFGAFVSLIFSWLSYHNTKTSLEQQKNIEEKKIEADLKAKSRIEWIQEVRGQVSVYLSDLHKLDEICNNLVIHQRKIEINVNEQNKKQIENEEEKIIVDLLEKLKEIDYEINERSNKILLFFSEKEDHKKFDNILKKGPETLTQIKTAYSQFIDTGNTSYLAGEFDVSSKNQIIKANQTCIKENIQCILQNFRIYLKVEWDRAKNGE